MARMRLFSVTTSTKSHKPRGLSRAVEAGGRITKRTSSQVANAVDGTAVQSRIDELQRQLAGQQAQIQDLQERLEHAIEITRDKQDEFASVAQAEGVSLSMARRLLQVVAGSVTTPSVPTLGRATEEAGQTRRPVARSARRGGPTQKLTPVEMAGVLIDLCGTCDWLCTPSSLVALRNRNRRNRVERRSSMLPPRKY